MPKTLEEITADVAEFVGSDSAKATEVATALREKAKPVAQVLINVGAKLEKQGAKTKVTQLETELADTRVKLEESQNELAELKGKTPDAKAIEERVTKQFEKKLATETERATKAEARAKQLQSESDRAALEAHLTKPNDQGIYVEPSVAKMLAKEYIARVIDKEDGSRDVLQLDDDTPYDGKDHATKLGALAADVRKKAPTVALITGTDRGSGISGGNGTGGGGSYDPVKAGTEMGKQDKAAHQQSGERSLAFQ